MGSRQRFWQEAPADDRLSDMRPSVRHSITILSESLRLRPLCLSGEVKRQRNATLLQRMYASRGSSYAAILQPRPPEWNKNTRGASGRRIIYVQAAQVPLITKFTEEGWKDSGRSTSGTAVRYRHHVLLHPEQ